MKYRWKMQILLLFISLVPLVIIALLYHYSTTNLGSRLAIDTQDVLTKNAHSFLQILVDDYGRILSRDKAILELLLTAQAQEIDRKLANVLKGTRDIIFAKDFDSGFKPPGGMVLSDKHSIATPKGASPRWVTYREQSYFLANGVVLDDVTDDIARLSTMPDYYYFLYKTKPNLLLRRFSLFLIPNIPQIYLSRVILSLRPVANFRGKRFPKTKFPILKK